jgi:tetratricopeptide (TPR) repeat protein
MQNKNEKPAFSSVADNAAVGDGINEFIQRHRKQLFVSAGVILLVLVLCIVALSVMDLLRVRAISAVEEFVNRYETLSPSITEEYSANDAEELIAEIEAFAKKKTTMTSGYAEGKAWSIIGSIHSDKKNWAAAEEAWVQAAEAGKRTYLAAPAFFNAGAVAEEQGKTEKAIEYYTNSIALSTDFSAAPRAQFAIGRLRETLHENEAAIEAYRAVISGWAYDKVWTNLAHSRIIVLEAEAE